MCKNITLNFPVKTNQKFISNESNNNSPLKVNFDKLSAQASPNDLKAKTTVDEKNDSSIDNKVTNDFPESTSLFRYHLAAERALKEICKNVAVSDNNPTEIEFDKIYTQPIIPDYILNFNKKESEEVGNLNKTIIGHEKFDASAIEELISMSDKKSILDSLIKKLHDNPDYKPSINEIHKLGSICSHILSQEKSGHLKLSETQLKSIQNYNDLAGKLSKNNKDVMIARDVRNMALIDARKKINQISDKLKEIPEDNALRDILETILSEYNEISSSPAMAALYNDFLTKIMEVIDDDLPSEQKAEEIAKILDDFAGEKDNKELKDTSLLGKINKIQNDSTYSEEQKKSELLKVITAYVGSQYKANAFTDLIYNYKPEETVVTEVVSDRMTSSITAKKASLSIDVDTTSPNKFVFNISAMRPGSGIMSGMLKGLVEKPQDIKQVEHVIRPLARQFIQIHHDFIEKGNKVEKLNLERIVLFKKIILLIDSKELTDVLSQVFQLESKAKDDSKARIDSVYKHLTDEVIKRVLELEESMNTSINPDSAQIVTLLEKFRKIIVELDLKTRELNNNVAIKNKLDFDFAKQLKENKERWNYLDEIKKEMQYFFDKSQAVREKLISESERKHHFLFDIEKIAVAIEGFVS